MPIQMPHCSYAAAATFSDATITASRRLFSDILMLADAVCFQTFTPMPFSAAITFSPD